MGNTRYVTSKLYTLFFTYKLNTLPGSNNRSYTFVNAFNPGLMAFTILGNSSAAQSRVALSDGTEFVISRSMHNCLPPVNRWNSLSDFLFSSKEIGGVFLMMAYRIPLSSNHMVEVNHSIISLSVPNQVLIITSSWWCQCLCGCPFSTRTRQEDKKKRTIKKIPAGNDFFNIPRIEADWIIWWIFISVKRTNIVPYQEATVYRRMFQKKGDYFTQPAR